VKKSCCLRVAPLCDVACANITTTSSGEQVPWVKELRYLGVYSVQSRHFRCTTQEHKKSFFRSVNVILGKMGRTAPEEVSLQLVFSKCIPVLLFGLESIYLSKFDTKSLDFSFNRLLMKLFKTTNIIIINDCRLYIGTKPPCSELLLKRLKKFLVAYNSSELSMG